nr:site-specific integrase [Leucobacter coleopterorum]
MHELLGLDDLQAIEGAAAAGMGSSGVSQSREPAMHRRVIDALPLRGRRTATETARTAGGAVDDVRAALAELELLGYVVRHETPQGVRCNGLRSVENEGMSLGEVIEQFLAAVQVEYGYSAHTVRAYRRDLQNFSEYAEERGVSEVGNCDIELMRGWLWERQQKQLASTTIARNVATLKSFGVWLERKRLVPGNPASRLRAPRAPRTLPRVLSDAQITRILDRAAGRAAGGDPECLRDHAVLELLYSSALRVSELCGLLVTGFDRRERLVRVLGKGNKERVVPVGGPAAKAVERYLEEGRPMLAQRSTSSPQTLFLGKRGENSAVTRSTDLWLANLIRNRGVVHEDHIHCATQQPLTF